MDPEICKSVENGVSELLSPAGIAKRLQISTADAINCLFISIGKGVISKSDLFFLLDDKYKDCRNHLVGFMNLPPQKLRSRLRAVMATNRNDLLNFPDDCDIFELELYVSYLKRPVYVDDMFFFLTELERMLHSKTECVLKQEFGDKESEWWKRGVPQAVRLNCSQARESDDESVDHPYHFTTFIHLKKIMDSNWRLFSQKLPKSITADKNVFLKDIGRLNTIRNQVMHPVRNKPPTKEDFEFVREMHKKLDANL